MCISYDSGPQKSTNNLQFSAYLLNLCSDIRIITRQLIQFPSPCLRRRAMGGRMSLSGGYSAEIPQSPRNFPGKINKDPGGKTAGGPAVSEPDMTFFYAVSVHMQPGIRAVNTGRSQKRERPSGRSLSRSGAGDDVLVLHEVLHAGVESGEGDEGHADRVQPAGDG